MSASSISRCVGASLALASELAAERVTIRVPATTDAVQTAAATVPSSPDGVGHTGKDGAARVLPGSVKQGTHTVWRRIDDWKGSYTIPYIQSPGPIEVVTVFGDPAVVRARIRLLREGHAVAAEAETTPAASSARFESPAPAEYTLQVVGFGADGTVLTEDTHERVGVGTVIAALGDSITEGYHSRGFWRDDLGLTPAAFPSEVVSKDGRNYPQYAPTTQHHRPDVNCFTSWLPRLNDLLSANWQHPVFIANEGWGGLTTANYVNLMQTNPGWQERMRLLRPGLWLIHLGVNDERASTSAEAFAANLAAIVDILLHDYAAVPSRVFVCKPCYDYAAGAAAFLKAYGREIDRLLAARGLSRGPDFYLAYSTDRETYYGADPVHPNLAGMERMAQLWAEAITRP